MKVTFSRAWVIDTGERMARAFIASFLGALLVSNVANLSIPSLKAAALAGVASAASLLLSLIGGNVGNPASASIILSAIEGHSPVVAQQRLAGEEIVQEQQYGQQGQDDRPITSARGRR